MIRPKATLLASLLLLLPVLAQAADGFVTANVNLRAGPDISYPLIVTIPAGTPIAIQGCTTGWQWCDVVAYGNRGWLAGNYLQYTYQNQPVVVQSYGSQIGIPIVAFTIGAYWGSYYQHRSFYSNRNYWYHRPPPPPQYRPPPRPPQHGRPPNGSRPPQNGRPPNGSRPPQNGGPPNGSRPPQNGRPPNGSQPPSNGRPPGQGGNSGRPGQGNGNGNGNGSRPPAQGQGQNKPAGNGNQNAGGRPGSPGNSGGKPASGDRSQQQVQR